jgi:hypothetical protein
MAHARRTISANTTDYTDGFGQFMKGAACEMFALDFYGDVYCKAEAATMGTISCYENPLMNQYSDCVETDYIAEITDCVTAVAEEQVVTCLTTFALETMNASAASAISTAFETCEDLALFTQGEQPL